LGLGNEVKAIMVPWKRDWGFGSKLGMQLERHHHPPPLMPDLGDSHDGLAGCSRVGSGPTMETLALPDLPPELILRIASLLEVGDLLAFRRVRLTLTNSNSRDLIRFKQSDKSIYILSQDKLLWRGLLRDLQPPLPRALRSRCPDSLPYDELEKVVLRSFVVERQWLERRGPSLTLLAMDEAPDHIRLRFLGFLDDRWVVSIPTKGSPTIWDTQENPPKLWEPTSYPFQDETMDAAVAVDPHNGDIIMGLRK